MGKKKAPRRKNSDQATERERVKTAVASGKVFTIYGSYPDIRNGLLERGWVEKQPPVLLDAGNFPNSWEFRT